MIWFGPNIEKWIPASRPHTLSNIEKVFVLTDQLY